MFSLNPAKLKNNFVYSLYTASVRFKDLPVTVELAPFKKIIEVQLTYSVVLALALVKNTFLWVHF